jgi:hypothetical protein
MSYPPQDPYHANPNPAYQQGYAAVPQPGSAPPYDQGYAAPVSSPPPFSGPPAYSAPPPFSAPPAYPPPFSGPPAPGTPIGGPAPARGRPTVLILGVAAALFFVLGGVMAGLFLTKSNELDTTRKDLTAQVNERDSTITGKNDEITKLQGELDKAKSDLDQTKQTLTGTQNDRDQIEKEKQVIARCLTLFSQSMDAALAGDRAGVNRLSGPLDKACTEAEKYV